MTERTAVVNRYVGRWNDPNEVGPDTKQTFACCGSFLSSVKYERADVTEYI